MSLMMDSSENPKRQANKLLVPVIASSSSELLPGTRLFASFSKTQKIEIATPDLNPSELTAVVLNLTSVQLSWMRPKVSVTKPPFFCIFRNGTPMRITVRRKVDIIGLTPHTKYVFGVQTIHSNDDYIEPGVNVTVSTDDPST
nr:unnamed protein product [Spirometra erinaceieuropaei]